MLNDRGLWSRVPWDMEDSFATDSRDGKGVR